MIHCNRIFEYADKSYNVRSFMIHDELLDIVDRNDNVIGQKYRSEVYQLGLRNFRAINAFLINEDKKVWIPRRTKHKDRFPLCLDASVGGHVSAGEQYDQAFVRETSEELNINVLDLTYACCGKLTPHTDQVAAFMNVYVMHSNIEPDYNRDDFVSADWYDIVTLQEVLKNGGERAKDDLPLLLEHLRLYLFR